MTVRISNIASLILAARFKVPVPVQLGGRLHEPEIYLLIGCAFVTGFSWLIHQNAAKNRNDAEFHVKRLRRILSPKENQT